ncbi:MAG: TraU family protein [Oligoflexales bacterium]
MPLKSRLARVGAIVGLLNISTLTSAFNFPNVCDVVNTPLFSREFGLRVKFAMCPSPFPLPPWPCAHVSYNLPKYFIEVVNHPRETMFYGLPGVNFQLKRMGGWLPFAAESDNGAFSYHAHVINVPFTQEVFAGLPCGGGVPDLFCFSAASEHLSSNWRTGFADMWHPQFKAWAASPKACLLKGAASSATGHWGVTGGGIEPMCSNPWMGRMWKYPPTDAPVCTGWGIHLPRTGTTISSDQTTASLMIASRIKSLGGDVFRSVSSNWSDKWQMIYPQLSSSFKEGQNIAVLRVNAVNELGRFSGKPTKFLYVVWQRSNCTIDAGTGGLAYLWLAGIKAACRGF